MSIRTALFCTCAIASITFGSPLYAADAAGADTSLDEVVVVARKRAENVQDVPLSVSAVTGETLERAGVRNIQDLQQLVPSLNIRDASANPSAVVTAIRGQYQIDTLFTIESSVGLYVDNVYIPRSIGMKQALFDVERIEVLKGPQGTLFGKNTTGGAISIFTARPRDVLEGYVQASYGSYDSIDLRAAVSIPVAPGLLSVRLAAMHNYRDEIERNAAGARLGNYDSQTYRASAIFTPTDKVKLDVVADYTTYDGGGYRTRLLRSNAFPEPSNLPVTALREVAAEMFNTSAPTNEQLTAAAQAIAPLVGLDRSFTGGPLDPTPVYARFNTAGAGATLSLDLGAAELKSISGYRTAGNDVRNDNDGTPFTSSSAQSRNRYYFYSQELQLLGQSFDNRLNWVVGGFVSRETGYDSSYSNSNVRLSPNFPNINYADLQSDSWSVFAQATLAVTDRLNVTGGLRWTDERREMTSENRLRVPSAPTGFTCGIPAALLVSSNPCRSIRLETSAADDSYLFSVDYHLNDDVMVYGKTSRGFRGGGHQLRGTATPGSFTPFAPETATDYELGLKGEFMDRRLRMNAAIFHTDYKDVQRTVTIPVSTGFNATIVSNAASAQVEGLELELLAKPMEGLTLGATYGHTKPKYNEFIDNTGNRTGEPWPIPENTYSLSAEYQWRTPLGTASARADWSWQDVVVLGPTAFDLGSVTQDDYGLLNLRATLNIEAYDLDVTLFTTNAFDKDYFGQALALDKSLGVNLGFKGEPRMVGVQLRKRFGG